LADEAYRLITPLKVSSLAVQNFTLGNNGGSCGPSSLPLVTIGSTSHPETLSYHCGEVGDVDLFYGLPEIDIQMEVPVSNRLDTDYFYIAINGYNMTGDGLGYRRH
jgi:hypothetical protein